MLTRRDFLQVTAATAALLGPGAGIARAAAGQAPALGDEDRSPLGPL